MTGYRGIDVKNTSPMDVARQLTLAGHALYSKVEASEFMELNFQKRPETHAPNYVVMKRFFNQVIMWAINQVLAETDLAARGETLKRLVQIADRCLSPLHNYDGLLAIVSALQTSQIHRLKHAWARLDRKTQKVWEHLKALTGSGGRKLRPLMEAAEPPCVPYLGLFLSALINCEEMPKTLSGDDTEGELIHFQVLRTIGDVIEQVLRYQQTPYIFAVDEAIVTSFRNPQEYMTDDKQYDRSLELEPRQRQ